MKPGSSLRLGGDRRLLLSARPRLWGLAITPRWLTKPETADLQGQEEARLVFVASHPDGEPLSLNSFQRTGPSR